MAIQAQQFPIAAVGRVVVVIVVAVMDSQFAHICARELTGAAPTDPRVDFQGPFPITLFALLGGATGLGNDAVQLAGVATLHAVIGDIQEWLRSSGNSPDSS